MDYIDRQAQLLMKQGNAHSFQGVQYTRRYIRLAKEAQDVGEDIQSLSQYVTAQKQAFRKILKKYRRWTGSSALELRMNNESFNQPGSLLNVDFMPLCDRLHNVQANLAAFSRPSGRATGHSTEQSQTISATTTRSPRSSASLLHNEFLNSSLLEFDAAFLAVPLGEAGGRATYWVHEDYLDQVIVLLRRYMKDRKVPTPSTLSRTNSGTSQPLSRRNSAQSTISKDRTHISMFDNLQRFIKAHGAVTIGESEDLVGSVSSMLAMSILWASDPEAVIITSDLSPSAVPTQRHLEVANVKSKHLAKLFDPEARPSSSFLGMSTSKSATSDASLQAHRDWLAQNRDIKPLAEVQCTRARFAGINNTSEVGTWALMDTDITMSSISLSTIGESSSTEATDAQSFPYTVLEVRWEFSRTPEIVRALDSTYLVERVRGFSIEAQAVRTICKPQDMPPPMWQSLLERDIRKVPPLRIRTNLRRPPSKVGSSGPSVTDGPSTSGLSASALQSSTSAIQSSATSLQESNKSTSPTSPLISKQESPGTLHPRIEKYSRRKLRQERQTVLRYWNEFDDAEERPEDQVYTIYVNPDEDTHFPGAETVSKAFSAMYQSLGRTKRRIVSWLPMRSRKRDHDLDAEEEGVRRPLLGGHNSSTDSDDDESSDTDTSIPPCRSSKKRRSAIRPATPGPCRKLLLRSQPNVTQDHIHTSCEKVLFHAYLGCYAISFILLLMSGIMKATSRYKAKMEVDAGIIVGVIAALGSAIMGISLMISREERLSWLHRILGGGTFLVICIGGGWMLAVVGQNL